MSVTRALAPTVHLHARRIDPSITACCVGVCGVVTDGSRESVAYRGLDPERVTCDDCRNGKRGAGVFE